MLDNRELALLIWSGIGVIGALFIKGVRSALPGIFRIFFKPVIFVPFLMFVGYVAVEVWIGAQLGLWRTSLIKGTLFWFFLSGALLFFEFGKVAQEPGFFRKKVKTTLQGTVLLEFIVNLSPMGLIAELAFQPVAATLAMTVIVAAREDKHRQVKTLCEALLAIIGFWIFGYSLWAFYAQRDRIDPTTLGLEFLLPVWLTLGLLPLIYALGRYAVYEPIFKSIAAHASGRRARWRAFLALVTKFYLHSGDARVFRGYWLRQMAEAQTFAAARAVIAAFLKDRRDQEAAVEEEKNRLQRYTGVSGTDAEGRQLDRREFKETIHALRWLSTCQGGWHRNQGGRYRPELLERIKDGFARHGLPGDPGITMRVAADGQSWYAWRRTVTGWCFAIGAAGPPPDEWEYDGPEPPDDFPGRDRKWGSGPFADEANRNWHGIGYL